MEANFTLLLTVGLGRMIGTRTRAKGSIFRKTVDSSPRSYSSPDLWTRENYLVYLLCSFISAQRMFQLLHSIAPLICKADKEYQMCETI